MVLYKTWYKITSKPIITTSQRLFNVVSKHIILSKNCNLKSSLSRKNVIKICFPKLHTIIIERKLCKLKIIFSPLLHYSFRKVKKFTCLIVTQFFVFCSWGVIHSWWQQILQQFKRICQTFLHALRSSCLASHYPVSLEDEFVCSFVTFPSK